MPKKQHPYATEAKKIKIRHEKLSKTNSFPNSSDTTPTIAGLADKFTQKTMTPPVWFITAITALISFCMSGSTIRANAGHFAVACIWALLVGISSSRKGAVAKFFGDQLSFLQPFYSEYVSEAFKVTIDGGTLPAISAQAQANDGTLALSYEEVDEFRKNFKIDDPDGLCSKLLSIYDGRPWKYQYKNQIDMDMARTFFVMLLCGQYETATDFLNKFKAQGFAPRIVTVYSPGCHLISAEDQEKAAEIWNKLGLDGEVNEAIKQLSFRFGLNYVSSPDNVRFEHKLTHESRMLYNKMSNNCNQIYAKLEMENSKVASAYGKLMDRVLSFALNWTAYEQQCILIKQKLKLVKPLNNYTELELNAVDERLKSQCIHIPAGILQKAYDFCHKNMLNDLCIREGYFEEQKESGDIDINISYLGEYLVSCNSRIISTSYQLRCKSRRLNISKPKKKPPASDLKKLHLYLEYLNIGTVLKDGEFLVLYNLNDLSNKDAVKKVLQAYQYLGVNQEQIESICKPVNIKDVSISQYEQILVNTLKQKSYDSRDDEWRDNWKNIKKSDFITNTLPLLLNKLKSDPTDIILSSTFVFKPCPVKCIETEWEDGLSSYYEKWRCEVIGNSSCLSTNSNSISFIQQSDSNSSNVSVLNINDEINENVNQNINNNNNSVKIIVEENNNDDDDDEDLKLNDIEGNCNNGFTIHTKRGEKKRDNIEFECPPAKKVKRIKLKINKNKVNDDK
eukprot:33318_1